MFSGEIKKRLEMSTISKLNCRTMYVVLVIKHVLRRYANMCNLPLYSIAFPYTMK